MEHRAAASGSRHTFMALISTTDIERQGNFTLTETGEELVNRLIPATLNSERRLGFALAQGTATDSLHFRGNLFYLSNPINVADVTAATDNSATGLYDSEAVSANRSRGRPPQRRPAAGAARNAHAPLLGPGPAVRRRSARCATGA